MTPSGLPAILALYGDYHQYLREDGTVSPLWDFRMTRVAFPGPLPLGWDPTRRADSCRVNHAIDTEVARVFVKLRKAFLWDHLLTFDGAYCWRTQRGSSGKLSMHAFGGALDFNASENGLGTKGNMDPRVVDVFEGCGWEWGGRWKRPDPMHFQFANNY